MKGTENRKGGFNRLPTRTIPMKCPSLIMFCLLARKHPKGKKENRRRLWRINYVILVSMSKLKCSLRNLLSHSYISQTQISKFAQQCPKTGHGYVDTTIINHPDINILLYVLCKKKMHMHTFQVGLFATSC